MMMGQGRINNNDVIRNGGIVQAPKLVGVNGAEIARCITLAQRRRRELLGPVGPHDPFNAELLDVLSKRPVPPNDFKEAWIDIQLALAHSCMGNDGQAKGLLERGLLSVGEFDHPLTAVALFELGRIDFAQGDMQKASRWFEEASYSAFQYGDAQLVEESLRYASLTHLLGHPNGAYPPLEAAAAYARSKKLTNLQLSCTLSAAEGLANLGRGADAAELLSGARAAIGNRDMGRGKVGARLGYIAALSLYQQGKTKAGDEALAPTLAFQRNGSLWLYHIGLVDKLRTTGTVSDRVALSLYENVIREPQPFDWTTDPLESLSVLAIPHTLPF
jgi:tetratricopeptide (TPR) repeat protein